MSTHTRRYVMPLTKDLVIGWPETIVFRDAPEESFLATRFLINAPEAGFCRIHRLVDDVEFCHEDWPVIALAQLPGRPVDPFTWMGRGSRRCKIGPLKMREGNQFRIQVEYTGHVPQGMRPGECYRLVLMLIGQEVEDSDGF